MNTLLKRFQKRSIAKSFTNERQACWEYLGCTKVLCPVHGKEGLNCWLVPKTHSDFSTANDLFEKLSECLVCPYFEARSSGAEGWNYFLADEVKKYNLKALEQIYRKEESFVEILNRIPDGLFTTDQDFRITFFNPSAEKITGFLACDAVGMYCKDVFKSTICENDCALKRAIMEQREIHNQEHTIRNIDGERIPIICSTSAFRDGSGRVTGGLEIFKDITQLKKLQEEVVSREKKHSRIFEGSHDMIYITNMAGEILDVNQAGVEMLGYESKEELMAIPSVRRLYWRPQDRDKFLKLINREGYVKDFAVDFKRRDGSKIHILISSRRYENPETGDIEFQGIIKDITERKLMEEILIQRNQELSILNSIAVECNLSMDLDHILHVTLNHLLRVLRLQRGAFFLIDRENRRGNVQLTYGLPVPDRDRADKILFKDTLLRKRLIEDGVELTPNPIFPSFHATYRAKGGKPVPWLQCFLVTYKGWGVGFFGFDIPSYRVLNINELHLLGYLGNFLGGAIENTRLMNKISQHQEALKRLTEKLFQGQEEERRRIARELHDEAGQALTAVKLGLDSLDDKIPSKESHLKDEIREIREMLVKTSTEIRRLSYNLHPTLLSDLGLEPALNLYFKKITEHSPLSIDFRMVGFDQRLDTEMETVLYRLAQEIMTNTLKHARAKTFRLSIIKGYPNIIFQAEDDGIGFKDQNGGNGTRSLGLLGMRERVSLLGGRFQLRSKPQKGTRIRLEIPLHEAQTNGATC